MGDSGQNLEAVREAIADAEVEQHVQQQISASFQVELVAEEVYVCNYRDSRSRNFAGGDSSSSRLKAAMRRECRGLVLHSSGKVLARPLHKYFCWNQQGYDEWVQPGPQEVDSRRVESVTRKLDGQMVFGLVLGGVVQYWTRAGPTQVGVEAFRVAADSAGDYWGFVLLLSRMQATPVFELVGRQSRKKAFEGNMPRLVLLAVRAVATGEYWDWDRMNELAERFGVAVVERLRELERLKFREIVQEVEGWHHCEGVVVRFELDSLWVKVKSKWWQQTGYCREVTTGSKARARAERAKLAVKKQQLQHHSLRLAVTNYRYNSNARDFYSRLPGWRRLEMVYDHGGSFRVAIATFSSKAERDAALVDPDNFDLGLEQAYSCRTRTNARVRVNTFTPDSIIRGSTSAS